MQGNTAHSIMQSKTVYSIKFEAATHTRDDGHQTVSIEMDVYQHVQDTGGVLLIKDIHPLHHTVSTVFLQPGWSDKRKKRVIRKQQEELGATLMTRMVDACPKVEES